MFRARQTFLLKIILIILNFSTQIEGFASCHPNPCRNNANCSMLGNQNVKCSCSEEFSGEYCQFENPCHPTFSRCLNGAVCRVVPSSTGVDATCSCPIGFHGTMCEIQDKESACYDNPCRNGGSCVLNGSLRSFKCTCPAGYTGSKCQDRDHCSSRPCQNGATCIPSVASFTCLCRRGFNGHTCSRDINECHQQPDLCLNGGSCENLNGGYKCHCPPAFFGKKCEKLYIPCNPSPCLNGGTCRVVSSTLHQCVCAPGFTGLNCEHNIDDCKVNGCAQYSTCVDGINSYTCSCPAEWTGPNCTEDVDECLASPCKNDGTCHNLDGSFICTCVNGWMAKDCSVNIDDCAKNPCYNGGTCHDKVGSYYCECPSGKTGLRCQLEDACVSNPCHGIAKCETSPVSGGYVCTCPPGWTGKNCDEDKDECFGSSQSPCEHKGTCINTPGSFTCNCSKGFSGERCELNINECDPDPCQNGGMCLDKIGRFDCICIAGFSGTVCEINVDDCASNPCTNGGICLDRIGMYECQCRDGFVGLNCQTKINHCITGQCLNGATCTDVGASYLCTCLRGFTGRNCEMDIDECKDVDCGMGRCIDQVGSYKCQCQAGYRGQKCNVEVDECNDHPCLNGGSCKDLVNSYSCTCLPGTNGTRCEVNLDDCLSRPCQHGGHCTDHINHFTCSCLPGFTGATCEKEVDECASNPCMNNGRCIDLINGFKCECPRGYNDYLCASNVDECLSSPCRNGATCVDGINRYDCLCKKGFEGQRCEKEINECNSNPCQHGGSCEDHLGFYNCTCLPGFKGTNCEINIDECSPNPCSHGGRCVDKSGGFECFCRLPYTGPLCLTKLDPCSSSECRYGARCIPDEHFKNYTCQCVVGFTGRFCSDDIDECKLNRPCMNGGKCLNTEGSYLCQCPLGYEGRNCETNPDDCYQDSCLNGGRCIDGLKDYECQCKPGFGGRNCQHDLNECGSSPCLNGATCLDFVNSYACKCQPGFSGLNCHVNDQDCTDSSCLFGGICIDLVNGFKCNCTPGHLGTNCQHKLDPCQENPEYCLNGGTCMSTVKSNSSTDLFLSAGSLPVASCHCPKEFTGPRCDTLIDWCSQSPCWNGATCITNGNQFKCTCRPGFTGALCDVRMVSCAAAAVAKNTEKGALCQNGGTCVDVGSTHFCRCKPGYEGSYCQKKTDECASMPCRNGATCHELPNRYNCSCLPGFQGINCEFDIDECGVKPCLNSGTCHDLINDFRCTCPRGTEGSLCEINVNDCKNSSCLNGGSCKDKIGGFECICPPGFSGPRCEGDVNECLSNRCHEEGSYDCLQSYGDYRCMCRPGWAGRLCDQKMMLCSLSACENGATCIETTNKTQHCVCPKGFSGNRCQIKHLQCEEHPCKNGGICVNDSSGFKCVCPAGFAGRKCEMKMTNKCFSNPCRHGGTCLEKTFHYQCICPRFWSGESCEIYDEQFEGGSGIRKDFQILFENQHLDCLRNNCSLKIGNGVCDKDCDSFNCNFDGYECSYTSKPYHSCNPVQLQVVNCFEVFNNGICDKACANELCLFDGWDCLEQSKGSCDPLYDSYCSRHYADGHCDRGCNTAECGWDGLDCETSVSTSDSKEEIKMADGVLVMVVMTSPEEFHNVAPQFFRELSFLLRSVPKIMHDSKGREMIYPWIPPSSTTFSGRRKRSTPGSKLYMKLDNAKCVDNCFTTTESASEFIAQSLRNGWKTDVPIYSVSSEQDVATKKTPVMMIVLCACIIGLISFLALVLFNVTKKRSSGSTWLPEGFVPSIGKNKKLKSVGQSGTSDGFPSTVANSHPDVNTSERPSKLKKLSSACASSDVKENASHRKWSERHFKAVGLPTTKISLSVPTPPFQDGDQLESPSICEDRLLLKKQPDEDLVDARGPDGYTPLMLASSFSTKRSFGSKPGENVDEGVAMISDLISQGATVNATTDRTGETPLHLAARYGKTEAAKHLLEAGGDPNAQDCNGRTPLHAAVASDAKGVFLVLLRHRATKVNAPTEDGTTPLMLAVRLSVEDLAEELIKAEADVNCGDRNGKTALHWAASVNNYDAAKMLLEKGANKDAQDGQEETPLYAACKEGSLETAKVLLHYKASADMADHMDQLPRDVAAARMNDDIVQLIDDYVKNNLELDQNSTRLNRAGIQKSHDGGMLNNESNFSLPAPKGKKLKKLQMNTDESQSLLLRPDALRVQNYEKQRRKNTSLGKFAGQNFFEMPPSYESACGRTVEDWKDIHFFNGMPVGKTLDSYSDQSFINFKVDTNQDNAINERLVSSMSPQHNITPGAFSHYYLPPSSQVAQQPMNVSSYPLMSSKETTSFGHNSDSQQFFNISESYSMFPMKGAYPSEQTQLMGYSMATGVTPNMFYNNAMNCSPDSTKNSFSDNKFSLKNSFRKLSAQTSQKPNKKNNKKRDNANIPLSPAHMQILVNQQQQHLQQNIKSFSQGQSPNHGCSEYQQATTPHIMNMMLMSQRPGMLTTCPSPSVPLQFDPYPTPSPDSPGIWSNSSPISGKSDHWSDNPVSSPNIQNFTTLPSCVLTRINSNDCDSGSNVY